MSKDDTSKHRYLEYLSSNKNIFPCIRYLDHCRKEWKTRPGLCKSTVLKFYPEKVLREDITTTEELERHFQQRHHETCANHLYLIQDLSEKYIEILGSWFWLDPYLFASQSWVAHWGGDQDFGPPHRLYLSPQSNIVDFTIRYYEVRVLNERFPPDWTDEKLKLTSSVHRRAEGGANERGWAGRTFFVRKNASFWVKKTSSGWDGTYR